MKINFKVLPLDSSLFDSFNSLSDCQLQYAKWIKVDVCPGYPCRVSLEDAKVGERVLAVTFMHHKANTPYQSSGPIFVREKAKQAITEVNEIPHMLQHRLLSIRGYSSEGIMLEAEIAEGAMLEKLISSMFQNPEIEYIHIHNAKPGCFNCSVVRA